VNVHWQPAKYDSLPLPHEGWGARVVAGFDFRGDETVIDAGCGTGRDAEYALWNLPRGRIIGLDASLSMQAAFTSRFAHEERAKILAADLSEPWPVDAACADAVMSVAAFHWLPSHDRVWHNVAAALKPGGVVRVDAGGEGNLVRLLEVVDAVGASSSLPEWNYAGVEDTLGQLRAAGLVPVSVELREEPAYFDNDEVYADYLRSVVLHKLSEIERMQVAGLMGDRCVDYVRLEVTAVKPG